MKEQQVQSDHEREQMTLNLENNLQEQEKLKLLNQQLQTQVTTLLNNPTQTEGELENNRSIDLLALDKHI